MNSNPTPPAPTSDRPQPGDLVMATAGDIKHPAVDYHTVSPSYLIFGVVHSYTYIKWASREGGENWNNYTNNFKRLHVVWEPIYATLTSQRWIDEMMEEQCKPADQDKFVDIPTVIPPVHHVKVKVICKKNSCNIDGLNNFVQDWIAQHFKFNIHSGWKFKTIHKKKPTNDPKNAKND